MGCAKVLYLESKSWECMIRPGGTGCHWAPRHPEQSK